MWAWCRYTRGRFECTHGDAFDADTRSPSSPTHTQPQAAHRPQAPLLMVPFRQCLQVLNRLKPTQKQTHKQETRDRDRQTDRDRQRYTHTNKHIHAQTGQDRTGQDRTGQDRTGQDRTGQDRTGQDRRLLSHLTFKCDQLHRRGPVAPSPISLTQYFTDITV